MDFIPRYGSKLGESPTVPSRSRLKRTVALVVRRGIRVQVGLVLMLTRWSPAEGNVNVTAKISVELIFSFQNIKIETAAYRTMTCVSPHFGIQI